jgi:hypothetical protein
VGHVCKRVDTPYAMIHDELELTHLQPEARGRSVVVVAWWLG